LSTLFDIPEIGKSERTMADYFESVTTGESSHVPADTGSIKEFADEFFRQFSLQPFQPKTEHQTGSGDLEILNRVYDLLADNRVGKNRLAYAKPLSTEAVLRTLYSYTLQLKRHGTVFLCSVPKEGTEVDPKLCKLGLLLRSPSVLSTFTILKELVTQGYVSVQYEDSPYDRTVRVIVNANPSIMKL
jgi:hypothetical protein